jgi:hypothetical protein
MGETVDILVRAWTEERVSYEGASSRSGTFT